jgi:Ca2+-binding RTX toxin-like protein
MASSFTVNLEDLNRILANIKIAEQNAGNQDLNAGAVNVAGQALIDIIGQDAALLPMGLRTVSGVFNHLLPGQENVGAADQPFPRLLTPEERTGTAAGVDFNGDGVPDFFGAPQNAGAVYTSTGSVVDSQPRTISNLIVDQSINNPAAVEAWFNNPLTADAFALAHPLTPIPIRPGEIPGPGERVIDNTDLSVIGNQSPDIGLSPQFNGFMTFFGQFFDHGLDLVPKGGNGKVYIPLQPDDPLYVEGSPTNFMVVSRVQPNAINITTPFIDQNQTYTSHASHQVFLREYTLNDAGQPVATGHLLSGATGGLPTWAEVKAQAADLLGIQLVDTDVLSVPLLATDEYGRFIRGPNGFVQIVTDTGLVEANPADNGGLGTLLPPNTIPAGTAFLDDIAHDAAPKTSTGAVLAADGDNLVGGSIDGQDAGTYDNELLDQHFITGDGRGNENVGLTAVHTVFHNEHDRLVDANKATILASGNLATINEWLDPAHQLTTLPAPGDVLAWNGERLFQAARFVTEMQYQHLVFEEFARKIQPNVDAFVFTNSADLNPAIVAEFAHTVYRFGHSMLNDTVDRLDNDLTLVDGTTGQMGLIEAFLNPVAFTTNASGSDGTLTAVDIAGMGVDAGTAAGAILRGMTRQAGNEIDEFVVNALRNNLVGLPLDLAAINIARGRDTSIPTLNHAREELYSMTADAQLKPYTSWLDFAQNIKHPESIINFIAAYGTHALITAETTIDGKRAAAMAIVFGVPQDVPENVAMGVVAHTIMPPWDAEDFLNATGAYAADGSGANDDSLGGLNNVDLWIGGLAEELMEFGGMLGSTFGAVFEYQMEHLQNGDRFYYLSRTQGMNLLNQLEPSTFADLVMRNTDLGDAHSTHISGLAFQTADLILELDTLVAQDNAGLGSADPVWDSKFQQFIDPKVVRIVDGVNAANGKFVDVNKDGIINGDDNMLKFSGGEHVVLGGTEGRDFLYGDKGIDTLWGDGGDDYLNAGTESDQVFGGEGDDIIEDPFGDNFLRGNQGNDVISSGHGLSLLFGDQGNDFIRASTDTVEVFGGEGDDFILGGTAADVLMGNEGDDWIEGGEGFDGLSGENSELFFNSPIIGHDVLDGQGNDTDYDGENGDDIMVQSIGIQRNNGMDGFDWAIHKGDPNNADSDLGIRVFDTRPALILRDRFDSVEGLSGWNHNDKLTGAAKLLAGEGFTDVLTQAGVDRIDGMRQLLSVDPGAPGDAVFESDTNGGGEIILGGAGSDTIRGNLGDDILDGDAWLNVRIAVHANKDGTGPVLFSVGSLNEISARLVSTGPDHINPGQLKIVREILNSDGTKVSDTGGSTNRAGDVDIAVFSDAEANYEIEGAGLAPGVVGADVDGDGFITVTHIVPPGGGGAARTSDGVDHIRNFEVLQFADSIKILDPGIANTAATGLLQINDPTAPVVENGDVLTVSIGTVQDADNPGGVVPLSSISLVWQFELTPGAGDWANIENPVDESLITGPSFTPTVDYGLDGLRLRVVGTFTGANGVPEVVFSSPTPTLGSINTPPVAANTAITGDEDTVFIGAAAAVDPEGAALTFTLVTGVANGVLNFANDGTFDYTPNADFNGVDSFTYTANDGTFNSNTATITFNVTPVDDAPVVVGAITLPAIDEDTSTLITATQLLANVTDIDTPAANVQILNLTPSSGSLVDNLDGTWSFTPALNDDTAVTFTYDVSSDGGVTLVPNTASLDLLPVNDAPTAIALSATTVAEFANTGQVVGTLSANDPDTGAALTFTLLNNAGGRFQLVGTQIQVANGVALDFEQVTSHIIQVQVSDGIAAPFIQNIAIDVTDVNPENVTGTAAGEIIIGGAGADRINGNAGDDILTGGAGADRLNGGNGNDRFIATVNDGNDRYDGGAGTDTYDLSQTTAPANVNLAAGTATSSQTGTDRLTSIENVTGSQGANTITGSGAANLLNGMGGNDTINGAGGADTINGGGGRDTLDGGAGNDTLSGGSSADVLDGGTGNDILNGGTGNDSINVSQGDDTIVVNAGFGNDVVAGFDAVLAGGQDLIDLSSLGITVGNFAANVTITDLGADTLVTIAGDGTLRLIGVDGNGTNQITRADFLLA